jgi:uncharacterized iron-regulated membrane protein
MKDREWLSQEQAEKLSLSQFVAACRRTLEEAHARTVSLEANPPAEARLRLSPYDLALLRGMRIAVQEKSDRGRKR